MADTTHPGEASRPPAGRPSSRMAETAKRPTKKQLKTSAFRSKKKIKELLEEKSQALPEQDEEDNQPEENTKASKKRKREKTQPEEEENEDEKPKPETIEAEERSQAEKEGRDPETEELETDPVCRQPALRHLRRAAQELLLRTLWGRAVGEADDSENEPVHGRQAASDERLWVHRVRELGGPAEGAPAAPHPAECGDRRAGELEGERGEEGPEDQHRADGRRRRELGEQAAQDPELPPKTRQAERQNPRETHQIFLPRESQLRPAHGRPPVRRLHQARQPPESAQEIHSASYRPVQTPLQWRQCHQAGV
ncbi:hypothetical protein PTTG_08190, partial [Puccinia triticina 1-1 BBBD Race 1]